MSKAAKRERQRQNREAAKIAQAQADRRARLFRSLRSFGIIAVVVVAGVAIFSFITSKDSSSSKTSSGCSTTKPPAPASKTYPAAPPLTIDPAKSYTATMTTSCGSITMALDPVQAPQSVNSFVFLSKAGFYNGTTFHRIVKNFVDQGGDPKGTGAGGPGYNLPDEPPANGYTTGSVALANSGPNTSGSQFFIAVSEQGAQGLGTAAPYKYSILGQVTAGMSVVKKINSFGTTDSAGKPTQTVYVLKVSITEGAANTTASSTPSTAPAPTSTSAP